MDSKTTASYSDYGLEQPTELRHRVRENVEEVPQQRQNYVPVVANPTPLYSLNQGSQPVWCPQCNVVANTKTEFVSGSDTQYVLYLLTLTSQLLGMYLLFRLWLRMSSLSRKLDEGC
jgi:hypothetical protein